ncbi:BtpA/SgcQ family protein [Falsiphaeobacter marinintestinus]|uniref:BtpA/SgcQ family protein n=1 Tax=Falsiphaeobacter marinintestinus TaxID=1492905 RepID=UPI0011B4B49C|nr:BtpA/SgcQ family protein [Phaeobacter marinintestinus]
MNRTDFHKLFKTPGPVVLPVIHVLDSARTLKNVEVLLEAGAQGCFLINHDFEPEKFLPIIRDTRAAFPSLWMAVNFLAVTGKVAFPILGQLQSEGCQVDAYWADDACIDEDGANAEAKEIAAVRESSGWDGLYFGGTAFKKQRAVDPSRYGDAAREACPFMDVITTSGVATGQEADLGKIETFRAAIGDRPMALASGISPENAMSYADVDCFMVATGINEPGNFYDIDPGRLADLMSITRTLSKGSAT